MSVLAEVIEASGPDLAAHAVAQLPADRFATEVEDRARAFVLEAVYEGHLLHYGEPRAFAGMDPDLRLLAGDALYALGLARTPAPTRTAPRSVPSSCGRRALERCRDAAQRTDPLVTPVAKLTLFFERR
jgi:hypothetical protein